VPGCHQEIHRLKLIHSLRRGDGETTETWSRSGLSVSDRAASDDDTAIVWVIGECEPRKLSGGHVVNHWMKNPLFPAFTVFPRANDQMHCAHASRVAWLRKPRESRPEQLFGRLSREAVEVYLGIVGTRPRSRWNGDKLLR
jgi:hypothetical protein